MRINPSTEDSLAAFVDELGRVDDVQPRVVSRQLAAIFEYGVPDELAAPVAVAHAHKRRPRMLTAVSGALATFTGKVALATAVAAASVGVAHASGVVDVPGLPNDVPAVENPGGVVPENQGQDASDGAPGAPDVPGVDGGEVSERATSGEPQEDGRAFGTSIADEATDGTPAEDVIGNLPDTPGSENRPDNPRGGNAD